MEFTGIGLYTLQEAEHLTGASSREVSRWLFGYNHANASSAPLWETQLLEMEDGEKIIGFRDLLELRTVKAFTKRAVPLRVIRAAIQNARILFDTPYPFTTHRFLTDGKDIFYEALQEDEEPQLTDLLKRQRVFEHIIRPELYAGIEFTAEGEAKRWFPVKKSKAVVLDPEIAFGKPILAEYGVRTNVIAMSYAAEKNKKMVAALYDIPLSAVDAALKFERIAA
jgi:uncharacterized protein (DUF433 family)